MDSAAAPEQERVSPFSERWPEVWRDEINRSEACRKAAAGWEGAIAFVLDADPGNGRPRSAVLDLRHGECRAARAEAGPDLPDAAFVLSAGEATWWDVLAGKVEPTWGLMSGKIRLERGSLAQLVLHVTLARELVAAARRISLDREEVSVP